MPSEPRAPRVPGAGLVFEVVNSDLSLRAAFHSTLPSEKQQQKKHKPKMEKYLVLNQAERALEVKGTSTPNMLCWDHLLELGFHCAISF